MNKLLNKPKRFVHKDITMIIKSPHLHAGELCHPVGKTDNGITQHSFFGGEIYYEMELENCPHLINSCFVHEDLLQLISGGDWKRKK